METESTALVSTLLQGLPSGIGALQPASFLMAQTLRTTSSVSSSLRSLDSGVHGYSSCKAKKENHYDTICSSILCPHQVPWETRDDLVHEGDVDVAAVDLVEVTHAYPGKFQGFLWLQRALQQGKSKRNVFLSFSAKHGDSPL